jgi:hypothetical protein
MKLKIIEVKEMTYYSDLSTEVVFDIPCLDRIGRIFSDHLIEVWKLQLALR